MCGGFVGDVIDTVSNVVGDAVDAVGNVVENIIEDPLPAIVDIGLIAVGVPPVFAGAIGGAVGAAEHGGDILQGALVGGATGYVGGAAGEAALNAGWSMAGTGAAMGAAQGATGAVLTGGDLEQGILGGAIIGGAIGYVTAPDGSTTVTYDDGSTLRTNPDGTVTATPATDMAAPVIDKSTYSPDAIKEANAAGKDVTVINPEGGTTTYQADGSVQITNKDGSVYTKASDGTGAWKTPDTAGTPDAFGGTTDANGNTTYRYDDGSTMTVHADGTYSSTPATDLGIIQAGNEQIFDDGSRLIDNGDGTYTAYDSEGNLYEPGSNPNLPKDPTAGTFGGSKGISWTLPAVKGLPLVPVLPYSKPGTGGKPGGTIGGAVSNPTWGAAQRLNTDQGLNPGWITEVPFYDTTDPSQAKYYWGASPFQAGDTFNAQLAKTNLNAPATPWGLQESFQPMSPEETAALVRGQTYQQQLPGAFTPAVAPPVPQAPAQSIMAGDQVPALQPVNAMPIAPPELNTQPYTGNETLPDYVSMGMTAPTMSPVAPQAIDLSQLTPEQLALLNNPEFVAGPAVAVP